MTVFSKNLIGFITTHDPEAMLMEHLSASMLARSRGPVATRDQGAPIRLLLSGYFGAGNTGSEMRSAELVRQIRTALGSGNVSFEALGLTSDVPADLFGPLDVTELSGFFPETVATALGRCHGVVACEGSTFKSTFSNTLSAMMAGTLGAAARAGQPAVAYGAEVGAMDETLTPFVCENAAGALVLGRNSASTARARELGFRAGDGADTAWTFVPAPQDRARALLKAQGWNGEAPVVIFCPMSPFYWPVRPNPRMAAALLKDGSHRDRHYGAVFFHEVDAERQRKHRHFIAEMAHAFSQIVRKRDAFPVLVGMDRVDRAACMDVVAALDHVKPANFMSGDYSVREIVGVLREASLLVSARFHALVGAMPAAVPSIGISIDERIRNLLIDGSSADRLIPSDADDLGSRIIEAADRLDHEEVRASSRNVVGAGIDGIALMAKAFAGEVATIYPDLPIPVKGPDPASYLPDLPDTVLRLLAGECLPRRAA
jgi:polysaccharide pyruvyl transferase WcaK-like protein